MIQSGLLSALFFDNSLCLISEWFEHVLVLCEIDQYLAHEVSSIVNGYNGECQLRDGRVVWPALGCPLDPFYSVVVIWDV